MSDDGEHPGSATPTRTTVFPETLLRSQSLDEGDEHVPVGLFASSNVFVGSPEHFNSEHQASDRPTSTMGLSISNPRSRPPPLNRISTTPLTIRRRAMSTNHRVISGLSNLQVGTPESDRWTLFGQLMENEGQLPSTPGRRPRITHPPADSRETGLSRSNATDPFDLHSGSPIDGHSTARPSIGTTSFHVPAPPENIDLEDYTDSESEDEDEDDLSPPSFSESPPLPWYSLRRIPNVPILYRNVLKCAIAYFIGSLFTFNPFLANFISKITSYGDTDRGAGPRQPFPSGHMVATIAVYYNPAKTMGGMIEADIFCLVGLLFAAFVCLSSMNMFWWLELSPGWEWLGDLVAILWIGLSMSIVSWCKVWMANPSFNTACSMTAIIISVVVVKEGGLPTLLQVSTIVVCGSLISNLVCYVIWPQAAIDSLQTNMTTTLDSFSTVLSMLTNTFLLEGGVHKKAHRDKMQRAVEDHQSSFTSLKKSLFEARTEWFLRGDPAGALPEDTGKWAYEDAIDSLNRLGQHLNGLRSGTRLQYELTKSGVVQSRGKKRGKNLNRPADQDLSTSTDDVEEVAMLKAAALMFGDLVDDLGPPLKALSGACLVSFKALREAFEQSKSERRKKDIFSKQDEFLRLVDNIEKALVRFESTSNHALLRCSAFSSKGDDLDHALLLGSDNEQVFLVYFFIFTMQEFAREVVSLIDAMGRIYHYEQDCLNRGRWWIRMYRSTRNRLYRRSSTIPRRRPTIHNKRSFFQMPSSKDLSMVGRIKQAVWRLGNRLTERDTKYAFKVGMAIAIFAAPAFYDTTRPFFVEYWGDWALISTNYLGLQRVLGTLFGAVVAATIFSLFPDSPTSLAIFGFLFSLPCFYYAVAYPEYLSASRFVLLTYNLSCLYCYNLRQQNLSVVDVAAHRALAVTAGVLWAAFISRFWWPAEARRELGRALGEFCLNIGWLYTRLVASNSFAPEYRPETDNGDDAADLSRAIRPSQSTKLNNSIKEFMSM
ncbi:hypothetical protein H0H92_001948 [Tricholoma furcatifolium]|nr:hypothetical protein H0H92_001948 [Tricholoma furcatifolium]